MLFLSLASDVAASRGGFGEERYEKEEMQRRVKEVFMLLQKDLKDAGDWHVIDASGNIQQVADRIWTFASHVIEDVGMSEIRSIQ